MLGTALGIKHGLRAMRPGGAAGDGGAIVNISSVAATIAFPGIAGYSATKSAVDRLTRVAAFEAGKLGFGVRVNCVYPGLVPTEMGQKLAVDMAELGLFESPEAAVGAVIEQTPARPAGRGVGHGRRGRVPRLRPGALHHGRRAAGRRRDGHVTPMGSLTDYLDKGASLGRDAPCLVEGDRTLSYGDVAGPQPPRRGRARARRHRSPARKVGILSSNNAVAFACVFGIARRGAVWCPINPRNEMAENRALLELFDCECLIYHASYAPMAEQLDVRMKVCLDELDDWLGERRRRAGRARRTTWRCSSAPAARPGCRRA